MYTKKTILLAITITALIGVGCGTDGLNIDQEALKITDPTPRDFPDDVVSGNAYSYTLNIENGTASEINLTKFTKEGQWLQAKLVNNGTRVKLSGTIPYVESSKDFGYSLTAIQVTKGNAVFTFEITVKN